MRISIVSPSFNQVTFIDRTIESVADQDYSDKEHIIIDGGSTDGSAEAINAATRQHPHIRSLIEPDRGQADAINKGLSIASGEILAWLNTDDHYSDGKVLSTVAAFFAENPTVDIAWGRGLRVDPDGRKISEAWVQRPGTDFTLALQHSLGLLQPSVFFRRTVFESVGGLSENWPLQLDYEYWIRIAQSGFRFGFIDRILSRAVVHADAKSTAQRMQQLNECLRLTKHKFGYVPIQWIRQYAEFLLTRQDHKVTKDLTLSESQKSDRSLIERALLQALNGDEQTLGRLKKRAEIEPYSDTWEAIRHHGLDQPRPRRIIITSFDSAYFQQGLNLIAALHRTSLGSFDEIYVYPLGLSDFERARLNSIEKLTLIEYPDEVADHFPEYLDPKTRAYKSYAIRGSNEFLDDGDLVLWMDAGLAPLKDIEEIFTIVEEQEFFITNHDDKKSWPFFNVSFAHPRSHEPLGLDNSDLLAPHLCSALIGYKRGGTYQELIDAAYQLGQIREAIVWPKVPRPEDKYKPELAANHQALRGKLADGQIPPDAVEYETLLSIFDYYGHRTQLIYSVLAHRSSAPVFSARTYRRSNDQSSRAAVINWSDSAFDTDRASSPSNLGDMDEDVVIYHHRGVYNNLDGMRYKGSDAPLFVVGNGPSLNNFPLDSLRDKAWIGMNAAYRYWRKVDLYPTYYACFDEVVLDSHRESVVEMIENRASLGISKFFLRQSILDVYPDLRDNPDIYYLEELEQNTSWFINDKVTTGSFSVLVGWFLGYREIYLLGIDLDYIERLPESVADGRALKIAAQPESNPNYFFDDYQREGDRYNPPNRNPGLHLRSWNRIASVVSDFPIRIRNLNPESAVRDFEFEDQRSTLQRLDASDRAPEVVAEAVVQRSREKQYWRESLMDQLVDSTPLPQTDPNVAFGSNATEDEKPPDEESVPEDFGAGRFIDRVMTLARSLIRWYLSPSGLLLAVALALGLLALLIPRADRWFGLAALVAIGIFIPYRFNREQIRTTGLVESLGARSRDEARELSKGIKAANKELVSQQAKIVSATGMLRQLGSKVDAVRIDIATYQANVDGIQSELENLNSDVAAFKIALTQSSSEHEAEARELSSLLDNLQANLRDLQETLNSEQQQRVESFGHAVQQLASAWSPTWLTDDSVGMPPRRYDGPDVLKGKKLIFCAGSGRVGTHYLSGLLGSCERVYAVHESPPYMIGPHLTRVLREPLSNSYEQRRIKAAALRATLAGLPRGSVYAETNHMFIKTFHDVVINEFPPDSVSVVVLRRSLDRVLKSLLELGYFTEADSHWPLWMYEPVGPRLLARPPKAIEYLDSTDRAIGYLFDIEARLQQFRVDYPGIKTVDAWLEDIQEMEGARTLLKSLGLKPTEETEGIVGNPTNARSMSRVSEIEIDECRLRIRQYHKLCQEVGVWTPDLDSMLLDK